MALITLGAFALRVAGLSNQSLWRDEIDAIWFALRPIPETLAMFTAMAQNGPLFFLSLRPWLHLVGSTEFALRLPAAMAGAASIPLLWQIVRMLAPGRSTSVATLASVFLAVNPYALWYGREGKMYALVTLLALAATWAFLRGLERGGKVPWVAYAAIVTVALYVHLLSVLLIPLHVLWFLVAWPQARLRWKGYAAALAVLILPYLPLLAWQWPMLFAAEQQTGFRAVGLGEIVRTLLFNQARGFMPGESRLLLSPIWVAGTLGLLFGPWEMRRPSTAPASALSATQRYLLLLTWATGPVLLIWLISLRQPVFTDRYVLWTLPAALTFAALGVQAAGRRLGAAGPVVALLLAFYLAGFWLYAGWQQTTQTIKYDLRAAVGYVVERREPGRLLILQIPHMEIAYRYYSAPLEDQQRARPFAESDTRLGNWAGGLWTNALPDGDALPQTLAEVDRQMRELTSGSSELWLLLSEPDMWDSRRLMDGWLDANADLVEQAKFHGATVRRYQFPSP